MLAQNRAGVYLLRNTHTSALFIAESLTAGVILINQSGTPGADFLRITGRSIFCLCRSKEGLWYLQEIHTSDLIYRWGS